MYLTDLRKVSSGTLPISQTSENWAHLISPAMNWRQCIGCNYLLPRDCRHSVQHHTSGESSADWKWMDEWIDGYIRLEAFHLACKMFSRFLLAHPAIYNGLACSQTSLQCQPPLPPSLHLPPSLPLLLSCLAPWQSFKSGAKGSTVQCR